MGSREVDCFDLERAPSADMVTPAKAGARSPARNAGLRILDSGFSRNDGQAPPHVSEWLRTDRHLVEI